MCCSVKYLVTAIKLFLVKVRKQILSLGVRPVAGSQTGNCRSALMFMLFFLAFFSCASAVSPFSTSLRNALQRLPRGRGKDSRLDFIFTERFSLTHITFTLINPKARSLFLYDVFPHVLNICISREPVKREDASWYRKNPPYRLESLYSGLSVFTFYLSAAQSYHREYGYILSAPICRSPTR